MKMARGKEGKSVRRLIQIFLLLLLCGCAEKSEEDVSKPMLTVESRASVVYWRRDLIIVEPGTVQAFQKMVASAKPYKPYKQDPFCRIVFLGLDNDPLRYDFRPYWSEHGTVQYVLYSSRSGEVEDQGMYSLPREALEAWCRTAGISFEKFFVQPPNRTSALESAKPVRADTNQQHVSALAPLTGVDRSPVPTNITTVTSETATFDLEASTIHFKTNVVVTDPEFSLTSDALTVEAKGTNQIDSVVARGNVKLRARDGSATCGTATYARASGKVILEHNAVLKLPDRCVSADKITLTIRDGRIGAVHTVGSSHIQLPGEGIIPPKPE